jgi:hypothetical protein
VKKTKTTQLSPAAKLAVVHEDRAAALAKRLGLRFRSTRPQSGSTQTLHWRFLTGDRRGVLHCWPATCRWYDPDTNRKGKARDVDALLSLVARWVVGEADGNTSRECGGVNALSACGPQTVAAQVRALLDQANESLCGIDAALDAGRLPLAHDLAELRKAVGVLADVSRRVRHAPPVMGTFSLPGVPTLAAAE